MTPEGALSSGFDRWLEHVAGASKPRHVVRPGSAVAPYSSSLRVTKYVPGRLKTIDEGEPLPGARPEQAVSDLQATGLLSDDAPPRLSPLGAAVLAEWRRLGVTAPTDHLEVVRAAALIRVGLTMRSARYQQHMKLWLTLREIQKPQMWFEDPANLVLVGYLNATDPNGYSPLRVLAALSVGFPAFEAWEEWADRMPTPSSDWPHSRLGRIIERVDQARRARGFGLYCQALEAVLLAANDPARLLKTAESLVAA